jgi:acetylglutamate kinase
MASATTVLKFGGELLEDAPAMQAAARGIARATGQGPLVVVHGGGRAIDAELRARGETPRFADGLRITDECALDAVVSVLAGRTNTAFVAALGAAGVRAIGLTGADGFVGLATRSRGHVTVGGNCIDLGEVGEPAAADVSLLQVITDGGYLPVVASIGVSADGGLLNVNADTFAAHLAVALRAGRLIIAGATAGVLDESGRVIDTLDPDTMDAMFGSGAAHSGMVTKLRACRAALDGGVEEVWIASGRPALDLNAPTGTRVCRNVVVTNS